MRNFRKLEVWKQSINLVKKIYSLTKNENLSKDFGLKSQLQRSAVSIPSNIAEGASRDSSNEFSRFLQISLGSSFELETQLIIAHEIESLKTEKFHLLLEELHTLQKRINALNRKVRST